MKNQKKHLGLMAAFAILFSTSAMGTSVGSMNTFSSGTPALASEVNGNFSAIKVAVDDNDSRLATLEAALTTLQSTITTLESTVSAQAATITTLQSDLTTASTNITAVQSTTTSQATSITALQGDLTAANSNITALESSSTLQATNITSLQGEVTAAKDRLTPLESGLSAVQNSNVMDLDSYLTVSTIGGARATLSAINLQIDNGAGSTRTINGLGNLIIGYDEVNDSSTYMCSFGVLTDQASCESSGYTWSNSHKTGSHYLVVGPKNNYSTYAGMVVGNLNSAINKFSSVTGGTQSIASGESSSVSGGQLNVAIGGHEAA